MPMKRGHVSAPQNTFIDTIIRKFDSQSILICLSFDYNDNLFLNIRSSFSYIKCSISK